MPRLREARAGLTEQLFNDALRLDRGNVTAVGRRLGITKRHTFRLLERYGLREYAADLRRRSGLPLTGRPSTKRM
jgi:DNA-binding NtrC family response regulator